ncbi:hypothetical protein VTI74DRAFT_6968 [Chaetomium olivicolor]
MLGSHFLGVNTSVQPKQPAGPASRREANLSETSACSAESEDADAPGFVFFQLGDLQYATLPAGQHGWPDNDTIRRLDWESTGFNLFARLGPTCRVESIWAIYNMFPEDEMNWWRNPVSHKRWGIPPTPAGKEEEEEEEQFSVAKVGNRLSDFGEDYHVVWTDKIEHPVELVGVVRTGDGGLLRATVDKMHRP